MIFVASSFVVASMCLGPGLEQMTLCLFSRFLESDLSVGLIYFQEKVFLPRHDCIFDGYKVTQWCGSTNLLFSVDFPSNFEFYKLPTILISRQINQDRDYLQRANNFTNFHAFI